MPSTTTDSRESVLKLVEKVQAAIEHDDQRLVERHFALTLFWVALVSKSHILYHGNPGNAKSMTVDAALKHVPDIKLFKTQAYKASTPEQFLGPVSFKAMENDEYRRITKGKFADCHVAFIDETARAPKPILTAFQGGMVEREFDNGSGPERIDLMTLVGTTNHLPDDEELGAFMDRFLWKLVIQPPSSQESFLRILKGGIERRQFPAATTPGGTELTIDELRVLQEASHNVLVPDPILEALAELWANLTGAGIAPSIRRYNDLVGGLQAYALLQGREEVVQDDLMLAQHALWTSEEERETVYGEVVKFASEWARDAADLQSSFEESRDRLVTLQNKVAQVGENVDRDMTNDGIEIVNQQRKLRALVEKQISTAGGRDTATLDRILDEMDAASKWVQNRLLGGLEL